MKVLRADDERIQAMRTEFEAIRAAVAAQLGPHRAIFTQLFAQVQPVWQAMLAGQTLTRKPSIGLRLLAADAQLLVALSPYYARRSHTVDETRIRLEAITEVERYQTQDPPTPLYQLRPVLELAISADAVPDLRRYGRDAGAHLAAVVPVVMDFVTDPAAVLRRSTRFCAVCGRHLTDGQSRARGVGPECLRHVSTWLAATRSMFDAMQHIPA